MPRILYVATVVKTHIMEFHIPYLKMLKDMGLRNIITKLISVDVPNVEPGDNAMVQTLWKLKRES